VEQSTLESFLGVEKTKRGRSEPEEEPSIPKQSPHKRAPEKPKKSRGNVAPKAAFRQPEKTVYRRPDGIVVTTIKAPGKPTIRYYERPGIKLFKEPVKCPLPNCNIYFHSDYDLNCHIETHWRPLKNWDGEWIDAAALPSIRHALMNAEYIIRGKYEYRLAAEGRIIIRKKRTLF